MAPENVPSILFVESTPTLRKRILMLLALRGIRVRFVETESGVLDQTPSEDVKMILVNLEGSGIDGVQFAKKCRELLIYEDIPIILLASSDQACKYQQDYINAGADRCLVMPLNESTFMNTVFQYIQPSSISVVH